MTQHIASDLPDEMILRPKQRDHLGNEFGVTTLQEGFLGICSKSFPRQGFKNLHQEFERCFLGTVE